ncbi:hypothetical protein IJI31_05085 [bacterium]|nr:hypothetical protein [bacterium]
MIFLSAQNIIPKNNILNTDKKIKKSVNTSYAHKPKNPEYARINSDLAISFLGIQKTEPHNKKVTKPLTNKELEAHNYIDKKRNQQIIKLSETYPEFARQLIGYKINGKNRFTDDEVIMLIRDYSSSPKEVKELTEYKVGDQYRFKGAGIDKLIDTYKEYPTAVRNLAKYKTDEGKFRFSGFIVSALAKNYSENRPKMEEFIEYRVDGKLRFTGSDIYDLADIYPLKSESVKDLAKIKINDKPRYAGNEIKYLAETYEKYPGGIRGLSTALNKYNQPKFDTQSVKTFAPYYEQHKKAIFELSDIKTSANEPRFFDVEIESLIDTYEKYPEEVKKLAAYEKDVCYPKFLCSDIRHTAPFYKKTEFKKFIAENKDKIDRIESVSSDNFLEIELDKRILHLQFDKDKNFKIVSEEISERDDEKASCILETTDGSLKIEQYRKKILKPCEGYIETIMDKKGNILSRTLTKPSKRNPDVLVVLREVLDKKGNLKEVQKLGTVENFGEEDERRRIIKTFVSPSGVESKQLILEVPKGMRTSYQIEDKTFSRLFIKKDKNTTETYAWGNKYETTFNNDKVDITVTKKDGTVEKTTLDDHLSDFRIASLKEGEPANYKLLPLVKELPGDFLYIIAKSDTKLAYITNDYLKNNAAFTEDINTIMISDGLKDDKFTFAHEFGHMLDDIALKKLHKDPELKKVFSKELDAYKTQASGLNEEQIAYFTTKEHVNEGGCLTEVIAETNAILSGLPHDGSNMLIRAKILQENFPETMKYIGEKIEKVMG